MALERVSGPILALSRSSKRLIVVLVDVALCALTVWLAYGLRLGVWVSLVGRPSIAVALSIAIALPIFAMAGLYRTVFRHVDAGLVMMTAAASTLYAILYVTLISAYSIPSIPRTLGFIQPVLLFLAVCLSRLVASWLLTQRIQLGSGRSRSRSRVLIYGAGSSGRQLARATAESREMQVVGFVDDDPSLQGSVMLGKRVYPSRDLPGLIERHKVVDVLLALPSIPRRRRNEIIAALRELPVGVRTLPGLMDLAHGRVLMSDLRALTIDDLLGRDPVEPDRDMLNERIAGRTILITGAGGSIGSELCRQLLQAQPARLLLVEVSEYALYAVHRELENLGAEIVPLLGSVTDRARMTEILQSWRPAMVFHAAAYKHVPLVEHNPLEGLRNNVLGTMAMAELAVAHGVRDFVLVSTDKAVRPTNVMGASKRLAELCLQALAAEGDATCLSMVRFGNVLGSSGSVVPLFRDQISAGGPITITDPEITRYFMTISEAAQLVVQASTMAHGGEVFVLDMGDPVKIYDLARNLIQLSGLSLRDAAHPGGDIEIVSVGLRPGEKLYEELLIGDNPLPTRHPRIMMASEPLLPLAELRPRLEQLEAMIHDRDVVAARDLLCALVPEYSPAAAVVDFAYSARRAEAP